MGSGMAMRTVISAECGDEGIGAVLGDFDPVAAEDDGEVRERDVGLISA